MEMRYDAQELDRFFGLSREAVLGIADGKVVFSNPAAVELLRLRVGDSLEDPLLLELSSSTAENRTAAGTVNGTPIDITAEPLDGMILLRAMRTDHTELPFSPNRSLSEFGASLATAHYAADALLQGTDADSDSARSLYRSLYRLRRLHRHFMLAQSISEGTLSCAKTHLDLTAVLRDICDSAAQTVRPLGHTIRFEAPEAPCFLRADPDLIETMLLNLLTNSLLYSETGREILVSLSATEDRCIITVDDPGCGIPPARLSTALCGGGEPALNDPKAGAGLGLYIARGIAEAHEGAILLESREGIGTSVRITLPRLGSKGLEIMRQPQKYSHLSGMDPILTEFSVLLDRRFYKPSYFD